jgi:exosortase H (IPTLxxWG-CTERM-specific)
VQSPADLPADAPDGDEPGGREPWLRFALTFGALSIASEALYYAVALDSQSFKVYLEFLARISGAVLAFFGSDAVVTGTRISSNLFAVEVSQGCDAIQVCSLLAAAVIAFPVEFKRRLRGLVLGVLLLQILNLLRIISLYLIGAYYTDVFRQAHEVAWPGVLIVVTIATWILWVRWETQPAQRIDDEA